MLWRLDLLSFYGVSSTTANCLNKFQLLHSSFSLDFSWLRRDWHGKNAPKDSHDKPTSDQKKLLHLVRPTTPPIQKLWLFEDVRAVIWCSSILLTLYILCVSRIPQLHLPDWHNRKGEFVFHVAQRSGHSFSNPMQPIHQQDMKIESSSQGLDQVHDRNKLDHFNESNGGIWVGQKFLREV